ncbi:UNVERIFIED_CONTAM: ammonium transporter [Trichonephila clavipes]|jgi:Amt family ammonium transporter|uniref:Ammonium transporter n=2 Tax=Acinetobacter venetianus TaxID=52133 RepID=A0A150I359_9GAMM|nr:MULTISPECIES: ammonium transporter [Acinetobacter]KXZ67064.1 Ammonium transporter NrgA [Acinetobacter venetianus]KXZ73816.1 Ammonium transporter NrgA [Acinetobacter venetianus]KXZ74820.1 Ammonium transporter NrgA [Acinetobacter venetianus]MBT50779.1 ammonium transporter [Acinetobacter sp.]GAB00558.1 putative two-component histidine kinase [Acinetobacter sp. NBRC 100985]
MKSIILILPFLLFLSSQASAEPVQNIQEIRISLDSVWVVVGGILVFFMQAGFALIESGSVRSKNTVNVLMKNYMDMCIGGLVFWLFGFGLMFGLNQTGWVGLSHFMPDALDDWHWNLLFFQMMFAATATTIASGAMAERIHFMAYVVSAIIVSGVIYPIFGSWAWGGLFGGDGWLKALGFIDFAGSTVVHSIGGWVALAGIIILGPRLGRFGRKGQSHFLAGHNLPLVALGGFILWFAWFGFNAASTVSASVSIGRIALNTHLAACAAAATYMILALIQSKAVLIRYTINASLAGLVAITAGCATMSPLYAVITGAFAGLLITFVPQLLEKMQLDDVVDAVAVHGVCGAWGTIAAGIFLESNPFNLNVIGVQALGVGAAFIWGFGVAFIMFKVLDKVLGGLRVSQQHEQRGLDYTEHAELSYPEFQRDLTFETDNITHRH